MGPKFGAIIVCGGKSSRMGQAKATLPFGPERMLDRIVRIMRESAAGPIVVVAARENLPRGLPGGITLALDEHPGLGPLEGLRMGLATLVRRDRNPAPGEFAFAVSCDVPLLRPALVRRICERLDAAHDAAVPRSAGFLHPLAAAYRIDTVLPHVERLVAERKLRATGLLDDIRTRIIDEPELRTIDPELESLRNMNTPEEYEALLRLAGLQPRTTNDEPRTLP